MKDKKILDHGGNLDFALQKFGGSPENWLDLSTGINPEGYRGTDSDNFNLNALPAKAALGALEDAARRFWNIPEEAMVIATHGASAPIALIPFILEGQRVSIPQPTYNEHQAAFENAGWDIATQDDPSADVKVLVHPNNPTGQLWSAADLSSHVTLIDESFCDVCPEQSFIAACSHPNTIILKSFGKFWGLAGVRLGFIIGSHPQMQRLRRALGPWAISSHAIALGTQAMKDKDWAKRTRQRLDADSQKLDRLVLSQGARLVGGCGLFRSYHVSSAKDWQISLAKAHIWTRIFPYSETLIRFGLPPEAGWERLAIALERVNA